MNSLSGPSLSPLLLLAGRVICFHHKKNLLIFSLPQVLGCFSADWQVKLGLTSSWFESCLLPIFYCLLFVSTHIMTFVLLWFFRDSASLWLTQSSCRTQISHVYVEPSPIESGPRGPYLVLPEDPVPCLVT